MTAADPAPRRTTITLAPGETVELTREPCACPEGAVCPPDSLFAEAYPRRPHGEAARGDNREDER